MANQENPYVSTALHAAVSDECEPGTFSMILVGYLGLNVAVGPLWSSITEATVPWFGNLSVTCFVAVMGLVPFGIALQPEFRKTKSKAYASSMCAGAITLLLLVVAIFIWEYSRGDQNSLRTILGVCLASITVGSASGFAGSRLAAVFVKGWNTATPKVDH